MTVNRFHEVFQMLSAFTCVLQGCNSRNRTIMSIKLVTSHSVVNAHNPADIRALSLTNAETGFPLPGTGADGKKFYEATQNSIPAITKYLRKNYLEAFGKAIIFDLFADTIHGPPGASMFGELSHHLAPNNSETLICTNTTSSSGQTSTMYAQIFDLACQVQCVLLLPNSYRRMGLKDMASGSNKDMAAELKDVSIPHPDLCVEPGCKTIVVRNYTAAA